MTCLASCNVLGRYCWTHKRATVAGIPGWPKPERGEFVRRSPWGGCAYRKDGEMVGVYGFTEVVVWANGDTADSKHGTTCVECGNARCTIPVTPGGDYREVGKTGKYWEWLAGHAQRHGGTTELAESKTANPDTLRG